MKYDPLSGPPDSYMTGIPYDRSRPSPKNARDRRPDAWDWGFSARRSGAPKGVCPYKKAHLRNAWFDGWMSGSVPAELDIPPLTIDEQEAC